MRRPVRFEEVAVPTVGPVTKLCGRPTWLTEPQWPISRALGRPMFFLGQFRLDDGPDCGPRLAYLFMTDHAYLEILDEEADPDGAERLSDDYEAWDPEAGDNAVLIQPGGRVPSFITVEAQDHPRMSWRQEDHLPVDVTVPEGGTPWQFLGGEPVWVQSDDTPGPGWRLVAQLDEQLGFNFGDAGNGYLFVSPDGAEGRFLWQCH